MLLTLMSHDTIPGLSIRLQILAPKQPIDIGRRPKRSPVEDGHLKQQKKQHPTTRSFQASEAVCVPNVVLTEPMPVLRSEPPHDEFVPESFKDAAGVHLQQRLSLGFVSKCLKVVNKELLLHLSSSENSAMLSLNQLSGNLT